MNMKPDQTETPDPGSVQPAGSASPCGQKLHPIAAEVEKLRQLLEWQEASKRNVDMWDSMPNVPAQRPPAKDV